MNAPARRVAIALIAVLAVALLVAPPAAALSTTVVISQVYGGAGCGTPGCSTYKNDYIELFNRGSAPVSLNGWSVQYASATGSFNAATALGNVTLQPGQYYLVAEAFNNNGVNAIPTADSTGNIAISATAGKVIVASTTTALGCGATGATPAPCSAAQQASIIDLIGFGTSATLFEGTGPAPAPSTTTADLRGSSGCTETDQNAADFSAGAPSPRNTASAFASCPDAAPSIVSTVPTAGAAGVALAADITVTFTEPVNVAAGWYGISCVTSGTHTASVTGGPTVFTINPDADFVAGESCTATIYAASVTDQDLIDPPDNMASNYAWTFSTASATPTLTINDVTAVEGNAGQTTFTFTVSLSAPAPADVTFNIATQDNSATTADNDYAAKSVTGATIPAGSSTYTFNVLVNGDTTVEGNETFFVNVSGVTGATVGDGQGVGTITNDDFTLTPIHDIQGPGTTAPIVGTSVTTRGVVTGVRTDGFFIQEPDASIDADPLTSEGILVYTGAPAPAAAVVGNYVQVGGTVQEYIPAADPVQDPLTEISGAPTVSVLSTGVPLPSPIDLTTTLPGSGGSLERYEGMLVRVPRMTTVAPTLGSFSSSTGTPGLGSGVFHGVVEGVARPFRQPGIEAPPAVTPPLPEWDPSAQVIRVDSDAIGGTRINIPARSTLTNVVGPLDYAYRRYTIVPLPSQPPVVETTFAGLDVPTPASSEFTVGSFNLENFGVGENATFLPIRMAKASLAIRNSLKMPDVLGIVEIKDLATLTSLANQVNSDAVAASQPNPLYVPYLIPGANTSINVGFLVKTAPVVGTTPRVSVPAGVVYAEGDGTFTNADGSTTFLNDRPSLRLMAVVNQANGASFPVTVIVNHLRSMIDVDNDTVLVPPDHGWTTEGSRVRAKRNAQAEFLANLVQARQAANPNERIVLVGDFNAFEFNDGYVDVMNTIAGTPSADAVTVVPGDGADLVNPDLVNLLPTSAAAERYSYVQEDTPQSIDHVVANGALVSATVARHLEHARIDADFPENTRNVSTNALRISDHDPILAFFQVAAFATADLAVTATDAPDPVTAGTNLAYTITVTNIGPDAAATASFSDTLPAGTTFVSLPAVAGWTCTTPAVGSGGTVSCSNPSFAAGSAVFTLTVAVAPSVTAGTVLSNTATATSSSADANSANNSTTATTTVSALPTAAVTATKSVSGALSVSGTVTYTIVLTNSGTSAQADNPGNELTDVLPAGLTLVSATATSGTAVATPATNTVTWNGSIPAGGTVTVSVVATVRPDVTVGTTISNQATISYDLNVDGVNEATGVTDDPATPAAGDATSFAAAAAGTAVIPTLGGLGLGVLALLVALGGALVVGRRLS